MKWWVVPALGALLLWGVWGASLKIVSQKAPWHQVYLATNTGILIVMAVIALRYGVPAPGEYPVRWLMTAVATGLAGTLGFLLLVLSLEMGGEASIVIPLTSLYPAVTTVLGTTLLGEHLTPRKALGIVLALVAIILLSRD